MNHLVKGHISQRDATGCTYTDRRLKTLSACAFLQERWDTDLTIALFTNWNGYFRLDDYVYIWLYFLNACYCSFWGFFCLFFQLDLPLKFQTSLWWCMTDFSNHLFCLLKPRPFLTIDLKVTLRSASVQSTTNRCNFFFFFFNNPFYSDAHHNM